MNENDIVTTVFATMIVVVLWWKHRAWKANRLLVKWMDDGMRKTSRMMSYDRRRR